MSEITIKNLSVKYDDLVVFDSFNATFEKGKINVILGGSGIGKSTLIGSIAGLVKHDGDIEGVDGGISLIFQKDRLIPSISVFKNLDLVLKGIFKDKEERKNRIDEMLKILEIEDCRDKRPTEISGGQAQRVALARAFLYPSEVLLMDEPFKALDTALRHRLFQWLFRLDEMSPKTIILVTHAIDECLLSADKYMVLGGKPATIVLEGRIDTDKKERKLTDQNLVAVRNQLLEAIN
ncbi:MAG: ABC transporter ATP-binding protein [Clostridia bacterium]|nr:ABC transporter ATP-binding protein [Clostridia bacterium]